MPWTDVVTLEVSMGFGSGPYTASPTWTDVVDDVRSLDISRGRSSVGKDVFPPGSATVVMDNRAGDYDPNNSAGSNYGDLNLGLPVRVIATYAATPYPLMRGVVTKWPITFDLPSESTVNLEVTDESAILFQESLSEHTVNAASDLLSQLGTLLNDVGWPSGLVTVSGLGAAPAAERTPFSGRLGTLLEDLIHLEQGWMWVRGDGELMVNHRTVYASASASYSFGGGNLDYENPRFEYTKDHLINQAYVTGADGVVGSSSDATSLTDHGPGSDTLSRVSNASITSEPFAANVADWMVGKHKDVLVRIRSFEVHPDKDPSNLFPAVLDIDLGDVVNVEFSPPSGDDIDQLVRIESITHRIRSGSWVTTYGCYPLTDFEVADFWILGTSDDLGSDTILA